MNTPVAIYGRVSKEDLRGGALAVESVPRQIEFARRAFEDGWSCDKRHVFTDEGITGAEVTRRAGLQAMLASAARGEFSILLVRDLDRLSRAEAARTAALLLTLADCGVRVWEYSSRSFVGLDGPEFLLTAAKSMSASGERTKTAARIKEGLISRRERGFADSAPIFGYRNVRQGTVVRRELVPDEIAILLHIARTAVRCESFNRAAVELNAEGLRTPVRTSSRTGHKTGGILWTAQSVRLLLRQSLYRGVVVRGRVRHEMQRGTRVRVPQPEEGLQRYDAPELRIWPDDLEQQIDALLKSRTRTFTRIARSHLASGFLRCAFCKRAVTSSGGSGNWSYVCDGVRARRCVALGYRSEARVDEAIVRRLLTFLSPDVIEHAADLVRARASVTRQEGARTDDTDRLQREVVAAARRARNAQAILLDCDDAEQRVALMAAHREELQRLGALRQRLAALAETKPEALDADAIVRQLEDRVGQLRAALSSGNLEARRAAVAAILGGARFSAQPRWLHGVKRVWQLDVELPGDLLVHLALLGHPPADRLQKAKIKGVIAPTVPAAPAPQTVQTAAPPVVSTPASVAVAPTPVQNGTPHA